MMNDLTTHSEPRLIASVATSADFFLDDQSERRLILSSEQDFQEVLKLRATCDAIMVGAETIRKDNPRLTIRNLKLEAQRLARGQMRDPIKLTITGTGLLDVNSLFFTTGSTTKYILCTNTVPNAQINSLSRFAQIIQIDQAIASADTIVEVFSNLQLKTVLIEGGAQTLEILLTAQKINLLRYAVTDCSLGEQGRTQFFAPKLLEQRFGAKITKRDCLQSTQVKWYTFNTSRNK